MKFTLTIDCDNAAFEDGPAYEVVEILHRIGDRLYSGETFGSCRDTNGNRVGRWELETDEEDGDEEG